jgi:rare lipoprotein A (peptidoglycan hydrolase)
LPRSTLGAALGAGALLAVAPPATASTHIDAKHLNVRVGHRASVTGRTVPASTVAFEIWRRGRWVALDRARSGAYGRYVLHERLHRPQSVPARVRAADGSTRRLGRLNVYRQALASWYGPGLYGNHLACGGTLWPSRLGVANKSLPCGSRVTLRHGRRVLRVPVIDRGPYSGAREFDLTERTARRLHFAGHGTILVAR